MNPINILLDFYEPSSMVYMKLLNHSHSVTAKALAIANSPAALKPDTEFIGEAAMLHDIGIYLTHSPALGCTGTHPYVCHGTIGREMLEKKGLFRHALVCERHVGVGITIEDIRQEKLPLPLRDMRPVSLEEEIICYADKFFSKSDTDIGREKTIAEIVNELAPFGRDKSERFLKWHDRFGNPPVLL